MWGEEAQLNWSFKHNTKRGFRGSRYYHFLGQKYLNLGVLVAVDNRSAKQWTVERGSSLFQLVAFDGRPIEVEWREVDSLTQTERSAGGFGSTGN